MIGTCSFLSRYRKEVAVSGSSSSIPISLFLSFFICRHIIAPEISLYNAKIVYQWNVALDSGSIQTKVDPTDSVHVTWTDRSASGGKWVTDFRLPLVGTTISALAADVRVRRQFSF